MTKEEAEEYAKEMAYRDAVHNALQGKCIPYRKATLIKLYELLDKLEQEPYEGSISRQAALDIVDSYSESQSNVEDVTQDIISDIVALPPVNPQVPSNDMVSRVVFEQVMWERDLAIEQLKDLGYGLGEKPKTGHWILHNSFNNAEASYLECSECGYVTYQDEPNFCEDCGTKMIEPRERSDKK